MPRFLDSHALGGATEDKLTQARSAPIGADDVRAINVVYNQKENKLYCLTEAPNKAVDKHHRDMGMTCDWITEVRTTA